MEQAVVLCRVILVTMDLPLLCATQMEAHSPSQAPARPIRAPWQAHVDIAIPDQEPLEDHQFAKWFFPPDEGYVLPHAILHWISLAVISQSMS